MELKDILKEGSKELNIQITEDQVNQLIKYK